MMRQSIIAACLACALGLTSVPAGAQSAPTAPTRTALIQTQTSTDAALDERQARDWGLRTEEWAVIADDILWRRSKLGLRTGAESAARLAAYLDRRAEAA